MATERVVIGMLHPALTRRCFLRAVGAGALAMSARPAWAQAKGYWAHGASVDHHNIPVYVGLAKGMWKEEGVELVSRVFEGGGPMVQAMVAGQLPIGTGGISTLVNARAGGLKVKYIATVEGMPTGWGIVAIDPALKSVKDLKGKKVAVNEGSVSQFFLNVVLKENGLTQKDVEIVNMKQGDAGAAFVAEKADAAVTWEPWLTKSKAAPHGQILIDSSKFPGLITDVLIFPRTVIEKRGKEIQGLVNAWNKAVAYYEKNKTESLDIMSKGLGDWLKDPKVFAETLGGVKFYNKEGNAKFFGTAQKPGDIYKVVQNALDVWGGFGRLQAKGATAKDLVNHSFVK